MGGTDRPGDIPEVGGAPRLVNGPPDLGWEDNIASKRDALLDSNKLKELHPIGNHPLKKAWEDGLGFKVSFCARWR